MAESKIPYTQSQLFRLGEQITYSGRGLDEIAFPLGGIGTGQITLGGWGQLRDWEIRNRPAKGASFRNGFFAIKAKGPKGKPVTRVLQGPVEGSFAGDGHSTRRTTGEALPHFREVAFKGAFPIADLVFSDPALPVEATLEAFNPFIPLNPDDSSIPVAILLYSVRNTSRSRVDVTVYGNLSNEIGEAEGRVNVAISEPGLSGVRFENAQTPGDSPKYGSMALAALWDNVDIRTSWGEETALGMLWQYPLWEGLAAEEFAADTAPAAGTATVAAHASVEAGDTVTIPFVLAWHFPNFEHWRKSDCGCGCEAQAATWKNWYATKWPDAWSAAAYVADNFRRLHQDTMLFQESLFSSTLPPYVLDAVSANISILKSPTVLRLTDGTFYGFEGCNNTSGCCEGSCTHVWNYAQALPYLFPSLQRSQREAEYKYAMAEDGFIQFRLPLPLGTRPDFKFLPAADGQMGGILQVWREYLISGDAEWLKSIWPQAKKALEFAWKYWDADRDGVMEGMQHNTFDIEFYGPNTMMGSLYLAALRAAEKIARVAGDDAAAREYRRLFESGSKWTDANIFNGGYYEQKVEPKANEAWPEPYRSTTMAPGRDGRFPWPKWQFGKGCLSDQLIGQWYAYMLDLGYLYERPHVRKALASIFRYNWRADLSDHPDCLRTYALRDEAGLLVGTWPKGERPAHAVFYADEVWTGVEYEAASALIYEGFVDEGLAVVRGARERYRGDRRNPWDEFECGHHYSRAMSSWSVLTALSGFAYDGAEKRMGFAPRMRVEDFVTFWSVGSGWGNYAQKASRRGTCIELSVKYGRLELASLDAALPEPVPAGAAITLGGATVPARVSKGDRVAIDLRDARGASAGAARVIRIVFDAPVTLEPGRDLVIALR